MRILGIDEAGRGCVLGPLVVGAYLFDGDESILRDAGADDSKRLSAKKRIKVRASLDALGEHAIVAITPHQIDHGNLNTLEEEAIVDLIRRFRPDEVRIDALGPPRGIPKVIARLQAQLDFTPKWIMEPKADHTYAVVGAASIYAKTTRDGALDAIREAHGALGSGYPSDPKTRGWMLEWAKTGEDWPDFVRTRWGTVQAIAQQALFGAQTPGD
ncbi:MAG: ribonuclease HII [Proteobacteria bacterium]|nr:ribonuclease HII [Pseudomonadota bacterium]